MHPFAMHVAVHIIYITHLFDELLTEGAGGAKRLDLESHILLGLGVKGWILNEAVDEDPYMSLDVERL